MVAGVVVNNNSAAKGQQRPVLLALKMASLCWPRSSQGKLLFIDSREESVMTVLSVLNGGWRLNSINTVIWYLDGPLTSNSEDATNND